MEEARGPKKPVSNTTAMATMGTPIVFVRAGPPEVRPDGSTVERFTAGDTATREWLRSPQGNAANLLFGGAESGGWAGGRQPTREREVHKEYRALTMRDGMTTTQWRQDQTGTIFETPLMVNPLFGAPRPRVIERLVDGQENPEWIRLNTLLSTPL